MDELDKKGALLLQQLISIPMNRLQRIFTYCFCGALIVGAGMLHAQGMPVGTSEPFGPANPFYTASTLPFHAAPFDKIKDGDYQPAIMAGMEQQIKEMDVIANDPAAPTFDNTLVAMERSGLLLTRAMSAFNLITGANTNPGLQHLQEVLAPRLAAHQDAIFLNAKLFARVKTIYEKRSSLGLDAESLRLVEYYYQQFVKAGANLDDADKVKLKKLNEEESALGASFTNKLLAAAKAGAYSTTDPAALAGLSESEKAAAAEAASERKQQGWVLAMQNTTQQPVLASLSNRATRQAVFEASWKRAEHGDDNDTRAIIARLAQLRAQKAALLGYPNFASWMLTDQMAKTADVALRFVETLAPAATANAAREASDIQALIDAQKGGFTVQPWDWEFYSEQVRKAKYDIDESQLKPYFELNTVLQDGVFYAAHKLYGINFKERKDLPVYQPDVRVFEVTDADGSPLALWYFDYYKRDNKNGGAWMDSLVGQSRLLGTLPVVFNVCNFTKPAPGQPALISYEDVTTMFHEFGHGLHGIFSSVNYPSLSGTQVPRDFVEFPSQFNEHWASEPTVFSHYAKHYQTGKLMPAELAAKLEKAQTFNQGYKLTELLAAADLDLRWHTLPATTDLKDTDAFEADALQKAKLAIAYVPPRYRSSYFLHIWANGYSAGYYAYLWSEMLDDDAYQWFEDHGGLTRTNGDRFRRMVLSRGYTEDLQKLYFNWAGHDPSIEPMLKIRGLKEKVAK